jgi:ATP-dependent exoDNAse (exonuclease V) beta subunit
MTLTEFAEHLRTHFADAREIRPSRPEAIQLITSQKAKGSEWQAVIVPFLTRDVRSASPRYPRLLKVRETGETIVLLDLSDATDEIQELLERDNRQEMERLLYVALTRAQHTLVLAFDNELFAKASGEIHSHSQSKWLKAAKTDVNEAAFARVGVEPASCALTDERHRARAGARVDKIDIQLPGAKIDKAIAVQNASGFVRKLNPSGLPSEESAALEEVRYAPSQTPRSTSPALRYGLWWHGFIQQLLWNENPDWWSRVFDQQKSISPDPARALREWNLLLAHLSKPENFRHHFEDDKSIVHAEMPFFWRVDNDRCIEGVIDLAMFRNGKCLILDWKTDRVPPDNTETLHARYRPQLAAYWKAVSEIAKVEIEAAIYSTAAGALVRYKTDELEKEWSRLEKLPPDQFDVEVTKELPVSATKPGPTKSEQLEFAEL